MNRETALRELERWRQERERLLAPQRAAEERRAREEEFQRQVAQRREQINRIMADFPIRRNEPVANQNPTLNVPAGSLNTIMMNEDDPIKDGNILVNFRGNEPNSYESRYGRFYRETTIPQLENMHPQTRGLILEPRRVIARIVPAAAANGPAARRRKSRKSRKSRKASRRNNRK
jgi:hypothetical protein